MQSIKRAYYHRREFIRSSSEAYQTVVTIPKAAQRDSCVLVTVFDKFF